MFSQRMCFWPISRTLLIISPKSTLWPLIAYKILPCCFESCPWSQSTLFNNYFFVVVLCSTRVAAQIFPHFLSLSEISKTQDIPHIELGNKTTKYTTINRRKFGNIMLTYAKKLFSLFLFKRKLNAISHLLERFGCDVIDSVNWGIRKKFIEAWKI